MLWSDIERLNTFFEPWRELDRMRRELSRLTNGGRADFPAVNVWTSPDNAVVTTEIPGIELKDLNISVSGNTLTLRGLRRGEQLQPDEVYHRKERWQGDFVKTIELPFTVESDKVEARYAKGVLYVSLPRAEAEKPRKIEVMT
jgi:HSP20 family protein